MRNRQARKRGWRRGGHGRRTYGDHDAGFRSGGSGSARDHRGGVACDRARGGRDRQPRRDAAVRIRWPDGLSAAADGGGAAGHVRTSLKSPEILLRAGHEGGAARLRHLAVRRRAAAGRCRAAGPRQVQAQPRDRFRQPRGGDRAGGDQPRDQPGGCPCRLLLRARPVVADRLLGRRECRGKSAETSGYDLMGIITGSEGLLGVITEVTVRILQKPETARALMVGFAEVEAAGQCGAEIIGAGITPGGMEMMDKPAIHAAEAFVRAGYPLDVEALLIIELDGPGVEVDELIGRVEAIAKACGSTTLQISNSELERNLFWAGRKAAFPAVGRISPDYLCMDGTIPRGALPEALSRIRELSKKYDLRVANVFHAGDGNLHPLILYDANKPGEIERAEAFGADILRACVELGGVLTGEHGVGIEKRDLMGEMFSEIDLNQQQRLKCAFDAQGLLNPGKVFPTLHRCAELGRMHVHGGRLAFPDIPRF